MGITRNSIDVVGITPEDQLPKEVKGQLIEYAETENINIPKEKAGIYNVLQISIKADIKSNRMISTAFGKIIVLDGVKRIKIMYTEGEYNDKANIVNVKLPFNTFIELSEKDKEIEEVKLYILDAYFEVINERMLYSHIIYLVDVHYKNDEETQKENTLLSAEGSSKKRLLLNNNLNSKLQIEFLDNEQELQEITITKQNAEYDKSSKEDGIYVFVPVGFDTVDVDVPFNDICS